MSVGFAGQHVVNFGDLSLDAFVEVKNETYIQMLYLIDYIAYGLHLWYKIYVFQGNLPKTYFPTSCLGDSLGGSYPLSPHLQIEKTRLSDSDA